MAFHFNRRCVNGLMLAPLLTPSLAFAQAEPVIRERFVTIDGVRIFYREAGARRDPTILLLHGFSSSSHMFRNLIPLLAPHFRVIAPDYPGFGQSDAPPASQFTPSFANLTLLMERFVRRVRAKPCILYMQDFGGPVGFRMAVHHPDWVRGIIIQNANAYVDGFPPQQAQTSGPTSAQVVNAGFIRFMYTSGARNPEALDPSAWETDIAALERPGAREIQSALIDDYATNIALYPEWQAYLRTHRPKTLVTWGRNDRGFTPAGAEAFRRDVPAADIRYFDTGHFALEEDAAPIAQAIIEVFSAR